MKRLDPQHDAKRWKRIKGSPLATLQEKLIAAGLNPPSLESFDPRDVVTTVYRPGGREL